VPYNIILKKYRSCRKVIFLKLILLLFSFFKILKFLIHIRPKLSIWMTYTVMTLTMFLKQAMQMSLI